MRYIGRASGVILSAVALLAFSVPASAVTANATDPSNDTSAASNDITSMNVELTSSVVTVKLTTRAALPAIGDPSWNERAVTVTLQGGLDRDLGLSGYLANAQKAIRAEATTVGNERVGTTSHEEDDDTPYPGHNFGYFTLSKIFSNSVEMYAFDNGYHGDDDACENAAYNISGTTLTMTSPATCFGNPGSIKATAAIIQYDTNDDVVAAGTDAAITSDLVKATSVDVALPGGYYALGGDGGVFAFGNAPFYGSTGNIKLNRPVVAMAPTSAGYRFVATDGGVFSYGDTGFYGSMGGKPLNKPVVGMSGTASGNGYWLVASDGGIFAFGDAKFFGSMGGKPLNKPIVGMAVTPTGNGYWMVASDGGIFAFGDAKFFGSMGGKPLNLPIVGMSPSASGNGYIFVAQDGGTFAFGDQASYGSGVDDFYEDVVGIAASGNGGYYLVGFNGDVFNYGPALDFGDTYRYNVDLNNGLVGMAAK